jgi:DNA polymerase III subunit epsilon
MNASYAIPAGNNLRREAIERARQWVQQRPVFLDTETTGLGRSAEIVEISVVDIDGKVLFESFVRPSAPIPVDVIRIHHITDKMVEKSPTWPAIWPLIRIHIATRLIGIYNEEYDLRLMQQSHSRYRLPWKENLSTACIMKLYAQFKGDWNTMRRAYRYHSLENAGKQCGLNLPNTHRAKDDTLLARSLLLYMAEQPINLL